MKNMQLGRYEHFKGGYYDVIAVGKHSETLEDYVVYRHEDDGSVWVRPLSMFTELVEKDGLKIPRFRYVGPST